MINITSKNLLNKAAIFFRLDSMLQPLLTARLTQISKMQGYPRGVQVIGLIMDRIKLDSYKSLLESLIGIKELLSIAATVQDSIYGAKTDKYQINRLEIESYINLVLKNRHIDVSAQDIDLIAQLIVSFESNPSAWILEGEDVAPTSNMHLRFADLYKSVISDLGPDDFSIYSMPTNTVESFSQLPSLPAELSKKGRKASDDTVRQNMLTNLLIQHRFAAIRILDHVYALMMDREIWYEFITPRSKGEVAGNLERANGLKTFVLYIQSLLTYTHFFALEVFIKGYEQLQKWLEYYPPLEPRIVDLLQNRVRAHDLLDAKADVHSLFGGLIALHDNEIAKDVVALPTENLAGLALAQHVDHIVTEVQKFIPTQVTSSLEVLDDRLYLPMLRGVAAQSIDMTVDVSTLLTTGKAISHQISEVATALIASLVHGYSDDIVDRLRSLELHVSLPFNPQFAHSWNLDPGVKKGVSGGVLHLDAGAPTFSESYNNFVRHELRLRAFTDSDVATRFASFYLPAAVDYDKATELNELLDLKARTLIPDAFGNSIDKYDVEHVDRSQLGVRSFIERLTGRNYDIVLREMTLPFVLKRWATLFSSFALTYQDPSYSDVGHSTSNVVGSTVDKNKWPIAATAEDAVNILGNLQLVTGHGSPYGATYEALASLQGSAVSPSSLMYIGRGIYLRFLNKVYMPSNELRFDVNFIHMHRTSYFQSNSRTLSVDRWVIGEGCLNFALIPIVERRNIPLAAVTPKHVYVNSRILMSVDAFFDPQIADFGREKLPIVVQPASWPFERTAGFLNYFKFGSYLGKSASITESGEDNELVRTTVEKLEKIHAMTVSEEQAIENRANANSTSQMGKAIAEGIKKDIPSGGEVANDTPEL